MIGLPDYSRMFVAKVKSSRQGSMEVTGSSNPVNNVHQERFLVFLRTPTLYTLLDRQTRKKAQRYARTHCEE